MTYTPPWKADLQPATWRGIQFLVSDITHKAGRRVAIHEYPFAEQPWVEDLGLGPMTFGFEGFLIGDDVASQYEEMKAACDAPGPGDLVHPRLGQRHVALVSASFGESRDASNVVSLQLVFLESATTVAPPVSTIAGTAGAFGDAISNLSTASIGDFVRTAGTAVKAGQAAVGAVVSTAQGYVREVQGVVRDATRAVNAVKPLANMLGVSDRSFGRFLAPLRSVSNVVNTVNTGVGSVAQAAGATQQLINGASKAGDLVTRAGALVTRNANAQ